MKFDRAALAGSQSFNAHVKYVYHMTNGRRVIVTGQTGLMKKDYLEEVAKQSYLDSSTQKQPITVCHVGDEMYREAEKQRAKIQNGKILNLPLLRLNSVRRGVFRDVLLHIANNPSDNVIVNTHSCFRWTRGLFHAFDMDLLKKLDPCMFITLIDDVDSIYARLTEGKDPDAEQFSLKDIMVWREEEVITTEIAATVLERPHYVIPRKNPIDTIFKLMFRLNLKKAYLSFPISLVMDKPDVVERIQQFKERMAQRMIVFDPIAIGEKRLLLELPDKTLDSGNSKTPEHETVAVETLGKNLTLPLEEIRSIQKDIDGQIISRDYKLIEQSDMVVALIPEKDGEPQISAGVQSELQYAHDLPRNVYVIWLSSRAPVVWVEGMTKGVGRVFRGKTAIEDAEQLFQST